VLCPTHTDPRTHTMQVTFPERVSRVCRHSPVSPFHNRTVIAPVSRPRGKGTTPLRLDLLRCKIIIRSIATCPDKLLRCRSSKHCCVHLRL
jgi:hypothetical protein